MICDGCENNQNCSWRDTYKEVQDAIFFGIGYDSQLGMELLDVMDRYDPQECEHFEEQ